MRVVSIVGDIVEKHQARMHCIFEVQDIQTSWSLVKAVAIAALIKTQQTAHYKPYRGFVRNHQYIFIFVIDHNLTDDRQRAC